MGTGVLIVGGFAPADPLNPAAAAHRQAFMEKFKIALDKSRELSYDNNKSGKPLNKRSTRIMAGQREPRLVETRRRAVRGMDL